MFSLASIAGVFGAITDMLVDIDVCVSFSAIWKWVDNFLAIHFSHQSQTEQDFMELTSQVRISWSKKKTRPLAACQQYISFMWDLSAKTVALPKEKVDAALKLIHK